MGQIGGKASIEVDRSLDVCWALAQDVASAPQWQAGLDTMEVLDRDADGRPSRCLTSTDAKVKTIRTTVRFSYDEPRRVTWTQEKGDLKSLVGSWLLEALADDRTRVTYELEGDPGRMLGMLVKGPVEQRIRELLVEARPREFKARVEA